MAADDGPSGMVRTRQCQRCPKQAFPFFDRGNDLPADSTVHKDVVWRLEVVAAFLLQESPVFRRDSIQQAPQISFPVAGERILTAEAFPESESRHIMMAIDHQLIVVAAEEDRFVACAEVEHSIDDSSDDDRK